MSTESNTVSDEDLARQAQAGSSAAFEALVCRYENRVYAFVAQHVCNPLDAREATQDTFVKAFQAINQFDPRRRFAPWLFTIARHKAIDRQRAMRPAGEPVAEISDLNTPDQALAAQDEKAALWRCARRTLPELQYQALWLHYAEEMNIAEIAQSLRKTKIHVKVLLFRARQKLSVELKKGDAKPVVQTPGACLLGISAIRSTPQPGFVVLREPKELL